MTKKLWAMMTFFGLIVLGVGILIGKSWQDTPQPTKSTQNEPQTATAEPVMAVEAIRPALGMLENSIDASGVIVGKDTAQVGAKISGVAISEVLVDVGDVVKAGQVLARLDSSTSVQSVEMAKAELNQARAAQAKAHADLERVQPLIKIDAISREQFDAYKTATLQADANVEALTARLNNAHIQAKNTLVIAPVSGLISQRFAHVGQVATGTPLFDIVKDGTLEWQASLPPTKASQIDIGQRAILTVAGETVGATVTRLSPVANNSRELTVHATIDPNPHLRGGMYQSGKFVLSSEEAATLPTRVITTTDGFSYVWTLRQKQGDLYTAHRQKIDTHGRTKDGIAVSLAPDTLVIKEGGNFLNEGDLVKLAPSTTKTN